MSLVSCHNQSNCEIRPSSAEEKVNDYIFDDGHKYDGWGCYRNGNFIPHGCGKAQYPEYYAYGNFKDGTLNGPAIISYDHYMYTMYFKNDRGNGWGLHINGGHLVEFGYYKDSQLQTNLTAFVRWYYEGVLVKSDRNGEKLMSMYTSKETKEVVNLLIGYAPKKESDSIALVCMGFRFKADGSVWVGNGNLNNITGNYIHFRPDGCVDIGVFINGVLSKRIPLQMFIDDYFGTHQISRDSKIASLLINCFPKTSTKHKRESEREKYRNIVEPKVNYSHFNENFDEEAINYASVETGYEESFQPFSFKSTCHQRYENNVPVQGLQECVRTISVEKNTNGCQGYRLQPGIGYIIKIHNDDLNRPNMSDKPMRIICRTDFSVEFSGFPIEAETPFGWQEVDYSNYGLMVYYKGGKIEKCVLHMYDRNTRIEYMQNPIYNNSPIKSMVDDSIRIFELGDISLLQQKLYELLICLNKRGTGRLITSYPEKNKLCEVFHLCLRFDWMHDNNIREVWAENAFYCVAKYYEEIQTNAMNRQDLVVAALDLFLTCIYGESSLYPKFNNILRKAYNHPIHYSYFSEANYTGGAKHLVREFKCFAATILAPIEKTYPQIISSSIRAEFENAKSDSEFLNISSEETLRKMKLMSDIFESILNDV